MKVVFDFAGVVFHWQPEAMLRRLLPHRVVDEASTRHWMGEIFQSWGGDWADFDRGLIDVVPLVHKIATRTGLPAPEVRAVIDAIPLEFEPAAATVALLRELREQGRELYFLSNMPAPYADHLEATHRVVREFRDGVFSARVHAIKPEPAIFDLAARRFGARPQELVFIDDVAHNAEAARRAGWQALHFTDAARCATELAALLPPPRR